MAGEINGETENAKAEERKLKYRNSNGAENSVAQYGMSRGGGERAVTGEIWRRRRRWTLSAGHGDAWRTIVWWTRILPRFGFSPFHTLAATDVCAAAPLAWKTVSFLPYILHAFFWVISVRWTISVC